MKSAYKVSREQLKRYLAKLHFETVPDIGTGVDQVCAHVRARRSVQFDPIDVVGRNADLVLQSRIKGYRPSMLQDAIYLEHRLYDGYDKNLCIYSIDDYPCLARMRREIAGWFRENPEIREAMPKVLAEVERRGALSSEDIDMNEKVRWPWGSTRISRAALESLWMEGRLAISRREGVRKYYDLFERCYDAGVAALPDPHTDDDEYYCWQAERRLASVGLLTGGASDAFLCVEGMKAARRVNAFRVLEEKEQIIRVSGDSFSGYIPAENEGIMKDAQCCPAEDKMRLIAPLDNLMWDRRLIEKLFGFEYRWEIYTPVVKRKYGYYVLPVMLGSEFAARVEFEKFDGKTLRIKNWWWEEGWNADRLPKLAFERCLEGFAMFLGAKDIDFENAAVFHTNFG